MDKYEKQIDDCYGRLKHTLERCAEILKTKSAAEIRDGKEWELMTEEAANVIGMLYI